jgi:dTDP-4-dehydrorhamnose reductase
MVRRNCGLWIEKKENEKDYGVDKIACLLILIGQSKYDGEVKVRNLNSAAIILRVPILYGPTEYNGESAVNALIDSVQNVSSYRLSLLKLICAES